MLLNADDPFQLILSGEAEGQSIRNIFYLSFDTITGAPDHDDVFDQWITDLDASPGGLLVLLTADYTASQMKLTDFDGTVLGPGGRQKFTSSIGSAERILNPAKPGTHLGEPMPTFEGAQLTLNTLKRHSVSGRMVQGGNRYATIPEDATDAILGGNKLDDAYHTLLDEWGNNMLSTPLIGGGGDTAVMNHIVGSPDWYAVEGFPPTGGHPLVDTKLPRRIVRHQITRFQEPGAS